jgi:hypothetical protein
MLGLKVVAVVKKEKNMTREDWLEAQLEREELSAEKRALYERELDKISAKIEERLHVEACGGWRLAEIDTLLKSDNEASLEKMTQMAMEEFGEDYVLVPMGTRWKLSSKVARLHHVETYTFDTHESAVSKHKWLSLQRFYNKYRRIA